MSISEQTTKSASNSDDQALKVAVAVSLLRSKLLQNKPSISESDALLWKRKAKDRKQELLRLREDLKEAEDASHRDWLSQSASCKCYFFDDLGKSSPKRLAEDDSDHIFNDVLRRRFLRQVRLNERRKASSSTKKRRFSDLNNGDETEKFRASVDFLVELCDKVSPVSEHNFTNWAHQAVDFILVSLKNLLLMGMYMESIEGIVDSLISRLVRRMCSPFKENESHLTDIDSQFCVQHLIRKLGSEPYIGQRALLSVSQRISVLAESLLFSDPFDDDFPKMHECMFIMIQLFEFLVSDYLLTWSRDERFDDMLFEEWMATVLHARKSVELLESRNGLYVLYMDRIIGVLAKQVGQVTSFRNLNPDILSNLFR
ncbi:hypothetical protein CFOL_v3_26650 [Cephalotus follicularis]|uniref:Protein MULTIPOLAR SPINDLE 1 n=1 Tax=Cephalotus follicularis TaxID=3775 RepID=A0A1Q3CSU0_CEPFO|nr:hypothetical protein CFOL_v3_26650 [Cephalotus follicularis]